jgi:sulfite reductase (NADPH) flavoprotein alpha-component
MTASALRGLEPLSSPLEEQQLRALNHALTGLSPVQLAWVSGYLAGVGGLAPPAAADAQQAVPTLTVLYGSQTGNARRVAESLGQQAAGRGLAAQVVSMGDYKPRELVRERFVLIVLSTQGEGEPPESARELHGFVHGKRAPDLSELRYAVLGLGDSSYEHFCRAAQELDRRLSELGAQRVLPRECCDVDFEGPADAWAGRALDKAAELVPTKSADVLTLPGVHLVPLNRHDRDNPYPAALIERRRLTTDDAVGDVRHLAFAVDPHQMRYTPGDALGVWFRNDPALVEQVLRATGLDADAVVTLGEDALSLVDALLERLELTQLHPTVAHAWSQLSGDRRLKDLAADKARLRAYAAQHQPIDLLTEFPGRPEPADLASALRALQPRLYSIASSQAELEDEVHLTVSVVRFHAHGRDHLGGASGFLAERLAEDATTGVYVTENPEFRLPEDGATPIIMVGAGTGVAPYRAFLQQRAAGGATGPNWLVLGNRHFRRDFLYQLDWQAWRKAGLLHRASLAFSRDGADKVYVQQRLREQAADVYRWLAEGAHLYVCGAIAMGQAVHQALLDVAAQGGGLNAEAAREFVDGLRGAGRYHRDLY